jgi:hypothetical protein
MIVDRIDGTIGQFTLTSPNPTNNKSALLAFPTITTTMFNGKAVAGITTQLDSFIIDRTPVAGPAGFNTFAVIPPGLTAAYRSGSSTSTPVRPASGSSATAPRLRSSNRMRS